MRAKVVAVGLVALVAVWGLLALGVVVASYAPVDSPPFTTRETEIKETKWLEWGLSVSSEEEARNKLPFESLVGRLPKGKPISPSGPLSRESKERWDDLDGTFTRWQNGRAELLKALHEKTRRFFVTNPGFGPERGPPGLEDGRGPRPRLELHLMSEGYTETSQRGEQATFPTSEGEPLLRVEPRKEFHSAHEGGMKDFFDATRFGYVKDREHVSGFRSHGLHVIRGTWNYLHFAPQGQSAGDSEEPPLVVEHIQLLGILTQPEPVVYLTDKLPSMEQVRQGKTRKLDLFETAGLAELRKGDDLFIAKKDETVRMLGALRATKVCLQCHDAKEGDMLGAFSYTLRLHRGE